LFSAALFSPVAPLVVSPVIAPAIVGMKKQTRMKDKNGKRLIYGLLAQPESLSSLRVGSRLVTHTTLGGSVKDPLTIG
jgi:hypothetical protein